MGNLISNNKIILPKMSKMLRDNLKTLLGKPPVIRYFNMDSDGKFKEVKTTQYGRK